MFVKKRSFDNFSIDGSENPWILIDFGWTRFIDGVNLTLSRGNFTNGETLEVRVGFEKLK